MQRTGSQRGEGKAGCFFWILLAVVFGLVAARTIPIQIARMQLEDYMEDLAMTQPRKPSSFFEREIFNRARELDLSIPKDQIRVKKSESRVIMDVQFTVPVDLIVTEYEWNIEIYLDRDIFLI